jgi:RNA polymerase sigma factor (sigma-70 family)
VATTQPHGILYHLRRAGLLADGGPTDGHLLERFLSSRDEAAFEALVRRHGPMVFGVCRRILRNTHDSEDAFQATFLVLACKASSVVPREMVGNWLHGVAYHTALKAKAMNTQRRAKERRAAPMPRPQGPDEIWQQLEPLLDGALQELPDKYRVPIVLCDLEGKTRRDVARQLGWAEGTVASRLARGRDLLARRLASRGVALSGAVVTAALAQGSASAAVPGKVVASTVKAASLFAAGHAATEVLSAKVVALTKGTLKAMLMTKLKIATAVLLAAAVLAMGGFFLRPGPDGVPVSSALLRADDPRNDNTGDVPRSILKWRFEKGVTIYQKATIVTEQTVKVQNQDVKQTQSQTMYYSYTPVKQDGNSWIIKQKIEGVQMDLDVGGSKITYDSTKVATETKPNPLTDFFSALIGAEFTITLDAKDMTVTKVEGHEDLADKLSKVNPQLQPLASQLLNEKALKQSPESLFASLPGTQKGVGETWTRKTSVDMGVGLVMSDRANYTYLGKDPKDAKLDKISVQHTLRVEEVKAGNNGMPYQVTGANLKTTKGGGTLFYNAATGRLVRSNTEVELEGTLKIDIGGQTSEVGFHQTQKSAVETSDKSLLPKEK